MKELWKHTRFLRQSLLALLLIALGSFLVAEHKPKLRVTVAEADQRISSTPPLYLPSSEYVRLISLGYNNALSNLLWFSTLNYFGEHYESDKDFRWLAEMCSITANLDPKAAHVYEFCATLLSWVAREPEESESLLTQAIAEYPNYWRYYYLRGFTYWYFLESPELARHDLQTASTLPEAPHFVASLASRMIADASSPETAIRFLQDLIANTNDEKAKKALGSRLKSAIISRDQRVLFELVSRFEEQTGNKATSLGDLVRAGMIGEIPLDPYKKEYYLDSASGEIKTHSGKKGLRFLGKTHKTGLAAKIR